jgi:hypothetical protein
MSGWFTEKLKNLSKKPWANLVLNGIVDGKVKFELRYNKAFLKNLKEHGYEGATDEEVVQTFLFGSFIVPQFLVDQVVSSEHPDLGIELSNQNNTFRKG